MAFVTKVFICRVTLLTLKLCTELEGRRTLTANDIKRALASSSNFDFLQDTTDTFDRKAEARNELRNANASHNDRSVTNPEAGSIQRVAPEALQDDLQEEITGNDISMLSEDILDLDLFLADLLTST